MKGNPMNEQRTSGQMTIWEHGTETDPSCKLDVGDMLVAQTLGGNDEANAGGTLVSPKIKVQMVKDAKAAIAEVEKGASPCPK